MKKLFKNFFFLVCALCLVGYAIHEYKRLNPATKINLDNKIKMVTITISIPVSSETTDGVPGAIETFGTSEDLPCFDPHSSGCRIDRSALVVGGNLNYTLKVPAKTPLDIGYILGNQLRADNIKVSGTLLNTFSVMGYSSNRGKYASNKWFVACFIADENQAGAVIVTGDPDCTALTQPIKLEYTK